MKKMVILLITLMLVIVGFLSGCNEENTPKTGDTRIISIDSIGEKYNASLVNLQMYFEDEHNWFNHTEIRYTKNKIGYQAFYMPSWKETLDWIKTNTSENCTILCWWDYGAMIEGYAERNVIARFGSLAITDTIALFGMLDEEGKKKYIEERNWTSNETIQELGTVLISKNISSNETKAIIDKYNVSYIFTNSYDKMITMIFFKAAGKNTDEFITDGNPNEKCNELLSYKMWDDNPDIYGLELIYEQPIENGRTLRIFKLV